MRLWPFGRRPEVRQASGYTTSIVDALEAAAVGGGAVSAATAAVETAAGLWGRCLSMATVTPQTVRTRALTPSTLEIVGRELARRGEMLFVPQVRGGRLRLLPAALTYTVVGEAEPETWAWNVTLFGPGSSRTMTLPNDAVVWLHYGRSPLRPWQGRAPWQSANLSGALLHGIERQFSQEASAPSGSVMPVTDPGDKAQGADDDGEADPLTTLRRDLAAAQGKTVLAPTMQTGYGAGAGAAPAHDFKSQRFGLDVPHPVVELRRDAERSILSSYGIPPGLASHQTPGQALREAWRAALSLSVAPVAELVQSQLREALDEPGLQLDLGRCRAADVATLARAAGSLVQHAGMPLADARAVVGL